MVELEGLDPKVSTVSALGSMYDEAKEVCLHCTKWKPVVSAYPAHGGM